MKNSPSCAKHVYTLMMMMSNVWTSSKLCIICYLFAGWKMALIEISLMW